MIEDTITIRVIQEAKNDDRSAMNEMIRSYQPVLTYIASCHLRNEDRVHETVRKCLGSLFVLLAEMEDLSGFAGKAMSMVVRNCLNAALAEDMNNSLFPEAGSDPEEGNTVYTSDDEYPSDKLEYTEKEAMNIVTHMLKDLPDDQRMVFVMRYLDALSFEKISGMIHIPAETLKQRAQLAKNALAASLKRSIPDVFAIILLAEENKYLVLDEEPSPSKSEPAPAEPVPPADPETISGDPLPARIRSFLDFKGISKNIGFKKVDIKSVRPVWLAAPAAILLIVLAAGFTEFRRPTVISALSGLSCSFKGTNGAGTAEITVNDTGNKKMNAILENTNCSLLQENGKRVSEASLSNGDVLTLACNFDKEALKKAHLAVSETSREITVEGLNEPQHIDLFEDVYMYAEVDEESGVVFLSAAPRDPKYKEVYYKVVTEDENGILVYADISDENLLTYGFIADDHYHTYHESDLPEELRPLVHQQIVQRGLEQTASYRDAYGYEVANGSDDSINALAQSYIGRGGACNEIANAFIYDLYGVRVHTGYSMDNMYTVESPEPGDLIYYYDTGGNYRHVATYIGNGLVLNGNYGDGTAHITSMYESWYAQNPMTFLRVQR